MNLNRSFLCLVLLCLSLAICPQPVLARADGILVNPAGPHIYDSIQIRVSGEWPTGCVPQFRDLNLDLGDYWGTIFIYAEVPQDQTACPSQMTPWEFEVTVGMLAVGQYDALVYLRSGPDGNATLYDETTFTVGGIWPHPQLPLLNEAVTVHTAGVYPHSCVPRYTTHTLAEHAIVIEAHTPDRNTVCGQSLSAWTFATAVGNLAAGRYTVEVYITDQQAEPPARSLFRAQRFLVVTQRYQYYFPWMW